MATAPLSGTVEAQAKVTGFVQKPESLSIQIAPFKLRGMRGAVAFVSEDQQFKVTGPLSGEVIFDALIKNFKPVSGNLLWGVDLSALQIDKAGVFRKNKKDPLKFLGSLALTTDGGEFRGASLRFDQGRIVLDGRLTDWSKPQLDCKLTFDGAPIGTLMAMVPTIKHEATGRFDGQLSLRGAYEYYRSLAGSPLTVTGSLAAQFNLLNLAVAPPAKVPVPPVPDTAAGSAEPLLPNWPLFSRSKVNMSLSIVQLKRQDLVAEKINFRGNYDKGVLSGVAGIAQAFTGSVTISQFSLQLLDTIPTVSARGQFTHLDLGGVLSWLSPSLKDYAGGLAQGQFNLHGPLPTAPDWLKDFKSDGHVQVNNGIFNTWQLNQLIETQLIKAHLKTGQGAKPAPVRFSANTTFAFANQSLQLGGFDLQTTKRDELQLDGTVGMDFAIDMKGRAFLSSTGVGGAVSAANSDRSGRLTFPVEVRGNLKQPSLNFAADALKALAGRTIEYEKTKIVETVKEKAQSEFQKEVEKRKQSLGKDLNKRLKGLFK